MDFDQEVTQRLSSRLKILNYLLLLVFLVVAFRLWYLQILKGDYFFDLSENNRIKIQEIPAPRGIIYDRNGKVVADNIPSFDISFLRQGISWPEPGFSLLGEILGLPKEKIVQKIKGSHGLPRFKPAKIKLDVSRKELSLVEFNKLDLPDVVVEFFPVLEIGLSLLFLISFFQHL